MCSYLFIIFTTFKKGLIDFFPYWQNVDKDGTVSTAVNNVRDIVEAVFPVITWLVSVTKDVMLDGQALSVLRVSKNSLDLKIT